MDRSGGPDACWPWTAARKTRGYGLFRLGKRNASPLTASRVAFSLANDGAEPRVVRHACDNPPCCNPAHLVDGTQADNIADGVTRGRIDARWRPRLDREVPLSDVEVARLRAIARRLVAGAITQAEAESLAVGGGR